MHNVNVQVREVNSEVLIFIDKTMPTELAALKEAAKILQREVLYLESHPNDSIHR